MAIERWWDGYPAERYWMEITDRDDPGANLHAPKVDGSGREYWSYSLVAEVAEGDIVFHWWKREGGESAIVGWSRAVGTVESSSIVWQAHGTVGRARGGSPRQPSWLLPLADFHELSPAVTLSDLRAAEPTLRSAYNELRAAVSGPLYFPFAFSDKRPLRTTQGYLVKVPAALVRAIDRLAAEVGEADKGDRPTVDRTRVPSSRDRRLADTQVRLAVEMHAVDTTIEFLSGEGWDCEKVGTTRPYDVHATRDDEELRVEVKGSLTACLTVELTDGEVKHARRNETTLLSVVDGISWKREAGAVLATGGRMRLWWDWQPERDSLVATRYRYLLPPDEG